MDPQDRRGLHRPARMRTAAAVALVWAGGPVVAQRAAPPVTCMLAVRVVLGPREPPAQSLESTIALIQPVLPLRRASSIPSRSINERHIDGCRFPARNFIGLQPTWPAWRLARSRIRHRLATLSRFSRCWLTACSSSQRLRCRKRAVESCMRIPKPDTTFARLGISELIPKIEPEFA